MRSSKWVWLVAVALVGCKPPTKPVYVDVATILAQPEPIASRPESPTPPTPMAAATKSMSGLPEEHLADRAGASGDRIRDLLQSEQQQALKELQSRLRRFYQGEANRFELESQRAQTEKERTAYRDADRSIRQAFEAYATKRMPPFTELTLFAGFPDRNPTSRPPEIQLSPVLEQRFKRTVALRDELKTIDDGFQTEVQKILGAVLDATAADRAAMQLQIEQFKEELDRRAEQEAAAQIKQTAKELGLTLIEPIDVTLPATPSRSVTIPAGQPISPPPILESPGILSSQADRERLLRHQLVIWLGLNRYSLASKGQGPDKTQQFAAWRKIYEPGS